MNASIQVARIMGIPIIINLSWLITLAVVTSVLALQVYPEIIPARSPYRNDYGLHWAMALSSGVAFFVSIVLHELAHSFVAQRQGIKVKNITLFIFGGVSQIAGESRRPLQEFVMAIVGPLTSAALGGIFLGLFFLTGADVREPIPIVLYWLGAMNLVLAIFNMVPAFPMDGGRVLRATIWGITHNLMTATRLATWVSRGAGYALVGLGIVSISQVWDFFEPYNGIWFVILGLFLEQSAKQSWMQARAMNILAHFRAEDLMTTDLPTIADDLEVRFLSARANTRFAFFVVDDKNEVVGLVTEKEIFAAGVDPRATVGQLMVRVADVVVAGAKEDGATIFQRMESSSIWQLPVISEGRVLGMVSRDGLIRLFSRTLSAQTGLSGSH